MYIEFTDSAAEWIRSRFFTANASGAIRLAYDTEGCGCAVNGVAALWLVASPVEDDQLARTNWFTVFYDPRQQLFFEDKLVVDRKADQQALVLKSSQQTYNASMRVIDYRESGPACEAKTPG
ncbi:iron-sulfur cluster biosynthesis family protein [Paenibacillus hodogayensis]|uniref:Iron-sulfur cluster biosynthesis family protein n=1 Tax=Paenibacillus hodogayensis TaxID=279208 RepID=A0ABV5W2T7_9BACL